MPRYHAYRTLTRQWLDRDLPLRGVTSTKTLSGPMSITATVPEDKMTEVSSDGLGLFEEWGTTVVREDDNGFLSHVGIMQPQTTYDAQTGGVNFVGPTGFFKGTPYDLAKTWGPDSTAKPPVPRPDPIVIARDLVTYVQSRADCNLGLVVTGATRSGVGIGDNEEPYRLQWWEQPDIGTEIDNLAQSCPFDYTEEVSWSPAGAVDLSMALGFPRSGARREDLRFEQDVNMRAPVPVQGREEPFNDVVGIGNGEGSTMVYSRATRRDGRLRRTKYLVDKTATKAYMDKRVNAYLEALRGDIDIAQVTVDNHPDAPLSAIRVGDDVRCIGWLPSYGDFDVWLRVLAVTISDDAPDQATIATALSATFSYIATEEIT